MCAGEGRDVIPVLTEHPRRGDVRARLVERDERNVETARWSAERAALAKVEVVCDDAGMIGSYDGAVPAHILLVCGVFGNISDEDVANTVENLPACLLYTSVQHLGPGGETDRDVLYTVYER